jgi:hypothetical protein
VRDADPGDAPGVAFPLEPGKVFLPCHEVVHLLELDPPPEPLELVGKLVSCLVRRRRPDLRCDRRLPSPRAEREPERTLGRPVHRRRVEHSHTRVEGSRDDLAGELRVVPERVPCAEPHHGPEAALLH